MRADEDPRIMRCVTNREPRPERPLSLPGSDVARPPEATPEASAFCAPRTLADVLLPAAFSFELYSANGDEESRRTEWVLGRQSRDLGMLVLLHERTPPASDQRYNTSALKGTHWERLAQCACQFFECGITLQCMY